MGQFFLEGKKQDGGGRGVGGKVKEDLAGDVIREITEDFERPTAEEVTHIKVARISVNEIEFWVALPQECDEPVVFFNEGPVRGTFAGRMGERAEAGADF